MKPLYHCYSCGFMSTIVKAFTYFQQKFWCDGCYEREFENEAVKDEQQKILTDAGIRTTMNSSYGYLGHVKIKENTKNIISFKKHRKN